MARRPVSFTGVAQPLRTLWHRFAFSALVLASFALLLLGKADVLIVERLRIAVTDAVAPIIETLSRPAASVTEFVERVSTVRDMQAEITRLEAENKRLKEWQHVAARLETENKQLKALSRFVPPPTADRIAARVIADSGGPFVRSVLINVGRRNGVRRGLAVTSDAGLIGSTVDVGEFHARVLLITDLNSQIPVIVESTRDPAVIAGDNTGRMKLLYLPQNANVSPGDKIVTSGHGGLFPPNLPVGVVTAAGDSGARVKPIVDWTRLELVSLLDYRLDGVVRSSAKDAPTFTVDPSVSEAAGSGGLLGRFVP